MADLLPKRSGCLAAFLVAMLVANPLAVANLVMEGLVFREGVSQPQWEIAVRIVLSTANVVFAAAVWRRRRWGVTGFAGSVVVSALLAPEWATIASYPLWSPGPLVCITAELAMVAVYALSIRHLLTRLRWLGSDTVVLVLLSISYVLLVSVPVMSVQPFDADRATIPAFGLLAGALLAALVRREGKRRGE